jgi:hypothetical protein
MSQIEDADLDVEQLDKPTNAELAVVPDLVANTFGEYLRGWLTRIRGGDAGALPVIGASSSSRSSSSR